MAQGPEGVFAQGSLGEGGKPSIQPWIIGISDSQPQMWCALWEGAPTLPGPVLPFGHQALPSTGPESLFGEPEPIGDQQLCRKGPVSVSQRRQ